MTHRKFVKFIALTLFVLLAMTMFLSSAMAATRKSVYTVKVENGVLMFFRNGSKLNPTYPLRSEEEVRLSAKNGRLVVSFTNASGKLLNLIVGNTGANEFRMQGNIPVLMLDQTLGSTTVTIDAKTRIDNLNVSHSGTLINYGTIGQCAVDSAATLRLKNNSIISSLRITGTSATVTADKKAVVVKAVRYKNGSGLQSAPARTALPPSPSFTPMPTMNSGVSPSYVRVDSISPTASSGAPTTASDTVLQILANVQPANATDKSVVWSVTNGTGSATIDQNGLLMPTGVGTVTVTAMNPASGVKGSAVIYITLPPEVIAQGFSVVNTPDFKGYNVSFRLNNATTSDVYDVEVTLWYGAFELAKCTSPHFMKKYPNAVEVNVPFDVFGTHDYAAEGIWN